MTTEPDLHDLQYPGDAQGTFSRLPFGMVYVVKIREDNPPIKCEYGINSDNHKFFVRMSFNDPDTADDIFETTDERLALLWYGHACFKLEEAAIKTREAPTVVAIPASLANLLSQQCNDPGHNHGTPANPVDDEKTRTGQYL